MNRETKEILQFFAGIFLLIAVMLGLIWTWQTVGYRCKLFGHEEELGKEVVEMEFVRVASPPKHFYCNIIDRTAGLQYSRMFVSKHFNEWRQLKPGTKFTTWRYKYRTIYYNTPWDGKVYYEYPFIHNELKRSIGLMPPL